MAAAKARDGFVEPRLDVSWIRVYLVLRGTSQRISSADVVTDLARLGFKYSHRSIALLIRGLETKRYLAQTLPRSGNRWILFRTTAKGRTVSKALRRQIREFFKSTATSEPPSGSATR